MRAGIVLLNELLVTNKGFKSEFLIEEAVQPSGRQWLIGKKNTLMDVSSF